MLEVYETMARKIEDATMQKVSIKPQPMSVKQAVRLFERLNHSGRREFYKSLSDDEKDALYTQVTDDLIASVDLKTKNRVDAKTNKERSKRYGYILPDECHMAENNCLWRSVAWYVIMGEYSKLLSKNLSHVREHFQGILETQE